MSAREGGVVVRSVARAVAVAVAVRAVVEGGLVGGMVRDCGGFEGVVVVEEEEVMGVVVKRAEGEKMVAILSDSIFWSFWIGG